MSKIILQVFFIINDMAYSRWNKSYLSIIKNIARGYSYIIAGYVSDDYKGKINEFIKLGINIVLFNKNMGKSYYINYITSYFNFDKIIYCDEDIIWPYGEMEKLDLCGIDLNKCVIVPRQLEDNRHYILNPINVVGNFIKLKNNYGFAGGVFISNRNTLMKYPHTNVGQYGPEDVLWFTEIGKDGIVVMLYNEISVIHPFGGESHNNSDLILAQVSKDKAI